MGVWGRLTASQYPTVLETCATTTWSPAPVPSRCLMVHREELVSLQGCHESFCWKRGEHDAESICWNVYIPSSGPAGG